MAITTAWQESPGHLSLAGNQGWVHSLPACLGLAGTGSHGSGPQPLLQLPLLPILGYRGHQGRAWGGGDWDVGMH